MGVEADWGCCRRSRRGSKRKVERNKAERWRTCLKTGKEDL